MATHILAFEGDSQVVWFPGIYSEYEQDYHRRLGALLGFVYLLNPGAGILELIPDNLPIVGNLDEGVAMLLIWYGLVEFFFPKKQQ